MGIIRNTATATEVYNVYLDGDVVAVAHASSLTEALELAARIYGPNANAEWVKSL